MLDGQLGILGQTLSGNFGFDQTTAGDISIAASNVSLSLGGGAVSITNGTGALLIGSTGLAGEISGTVGVTIPGVSFAGNFKVGINTTAAAVSKSFELGDDEIVLNLPAGPYLRVEGEGVNLTILGQTLSGNFIFERSGTTTVIAARDVTFALSAGGTDIVRLDDGEGAFVVIDRRPRRAHRRPRHADPAGRGQLHRLVHRWRSTTRTPPSNQTIDVAGEDVTLDLPAGPYLRVEGTGVQLDILGQRLSGDFAFERATDLGDDNVPGGTALADQDTTIVRVGATNVALSLGGVITVSSGQGALFITPAGIAGRVTGNVAVNVPGVSLSGALAVEFNNTADEVDETIMVGSSAVTLDLAGRARTSGSPAPASTSTSSARRSAATSRSRRRRRASRSSSTTFS